MNCENLFDERQARYEPLYGSARAGDLFGLAVAANPRAANSVLTEGQMVAAADRMADRLAVQEAQQNALPEGKTLEQRREDVRKTKRQEVLNSLMPFKIIALTAPRGRVVSGSGFVQFVSGTGANREVVLRIHRFTQEAGLAVAALTEFADKAKQSVRIEISAAPDADRDAVGIRGKIMDLVAPIDSAGVRRVPRPRMHLVDLSKADTQPSRMPLGLRALGVVSRLGSGAVTPALPMKELLKIVREESGIQSQIEQLQKRMAEAREDRDGGGAQEDVWKLFQKMQALSEKLTEVRAKRDKLLNEMRYAAIVLDAADQAGLLPATPGTAETAPGLLISSLAKAKDAQGAAEAVQTFWGAEPAERENTAAWTLGVEEGRGEPRIVNVNVPQNLAERAVQAVTNALSSAAADGRDWAGVVVAHFQRALRLAEKAGNKPKTMEEVQALAVEQLAPVRNNVASGSKDAADKAERAVTDLQTVIENAVNEAMNVALKEAVKAAFKKSEDDEASGGIVAELGKPIVLVVNGHAPSDGEKPLIQDLAAGILRKEYPEKPVPPIHLATADEVREYRKKIAEEHEARREEVVRNLKGSAVFDPRPDRQYVAQAVVTLGILAVVMFGVGMLVAGVPIVIGVATGKVAGLSGALIIAKANLTGFITTHIVTAAHATGRAAAHGTGATIVAWAKMWLVKSLATLPIGVGAHIARGRLLKATGFSDQSNPFQGSKDAGAMKTMGLNMLVSMGIGWGLVLAVNHALGAMTLGIGGWWMLSMITPLVVQPVTALGKKVWELYLEIRRFGIRSLFQRSRQSARTRRAAPTATRGSVFGRLMPWAPRLVGGGAVISLALLLLSRAQASPIVQSAVKHASSDAVQPTLASHVFHTAHQVREASGPNFWQNLLHNPKAILTMVLVIAAVAIVAYMVAAHFNDRNDPPTAGSGGGGPPEPPLPPDQTPSRRSLRRGPMSLTGAA